MTVTTCSSNNTKANFSGHVIITMIIKCAIFVSACPTRIDLAIVMDQSSSITWVQEKNWEVMKNFVINLVSAFPISPTLTRVGLVKFSDDAQTAFNLAAFSTAQQIINAINGSIHEGGLTNLADALRVTRTSIFNAPGDRPQVKNICIFITDGHATVDPDLVTNEAILAQREAEIFAIGITNDVDTLELETIASDPNNRHTFLVDDFNLLQGILNDVIEETCAVVTTIEPPSPVTSQSPVVGKLKYIAILFIQIVKYIYSLKLRFHYTCSEVTNFQIVPITLQWK